METLNIKGMMKNRSLTMAIAEQKWFEFKRQIKYKAEEYGIEVVEVDRFYASSKTCSHCGHIKTDLKLSDRTYRCSECGLVIDRDLNAAINLAHYSSQLRKLSLRRAKSSASSLGKSGLDEQGNVATS